jgi:archaemetzincin
MPILSVDNLHKNQQKVTDKALLDLILLGHVNETAVSIVAANLQTLMGLNTDVRPILAKPDYAYVPGRNQFDAAKIIKTLCSISDGAPLKLGLIESDLCSPILSFVYGESQLGGKAALVSLHRLFAKDQEVIYQRITKISLHEVGHLLGIRHCWKTTCLMKHSGDLDSLDSLSMYFCSACEYEIERRLQMLINLNT